VTAIRRLSLRQAARFALTGGGIAAIVTLIVTASDVLMPFIVGLVLAYLLMPLVNRLSRWLPRWFAILLVYAAGAAALGMLTVFLVPPLISQGIRLVATATQPEGLAQLADEGLRWYRANVPASLQAPSSSFCCCAPCRRFRTT